MQKLFSSKGLRDAALFIIVLDQHPVGAGAFIALVVAVGLWEKLSIGRRGGGGRDAD